MRRVHPALLLLLVLTACARPPAGVGSDPSQAIYLEGVPSEYSVRLDALPSSNLLGDDSVMRDALIAGDPSLYVAATLFTCGDYVVMDLIVLNQDDAPVQLARGSMHVVNGDGRWLSAVEDFEGAEQHGLRARLCRATPSVLYEVPDATPDDLSLVGADYSARPSKSVAPPAPLPSRSGGGVQAWRSGQSGFRSAPNAPETLVVAPDEGRAYWAYWKAEDLQNPLTAVVMLEEEQLLFRFER